MLNNFVDTKAKRRLLKVLFSFPERGFHQNELKEMLRMSSRRLSTILGELVKKNVINFTSKKRSRYYRINSHLSWYDELQGLVAGEKIAREDLVSKRLKKFSSAKVIVLTGVFTGQPQVEVDLVLVGRRLGHTKINRLLDDLEKLAGQELNYTTMGAEEYEYRQMMSDRFIRDVLDNPHLVVVNKLTKRRKRKNV